MVLVNTDWSGPGVAVKARVLLVPSMKLIGLLPITFHPAPGVFSTAPAVIVAVLFSVLVAAFCTHQVGRAVAVQVHPGHRTGLARSGVAEIGRADDQGSRLKLFMR